MSDEKVLDTEQAIRDMAKLSMIENKVNDVQLTNLKMYPLVFFNGVRSASIDYDFYADKPAVEFEEDKKNLEIKYKFNKPKTNCKVAYRLDIDETVDNSHLEKRFQAIEQAVRNLFWKNTSVKVFFNDKMVFESK